MAGDTNSEKKNDMKPFIYLGIAVFILWLAVGAGIYFLFVDWEDRGTFGDMFGVINSHDLCTSC